MNRHTSLVFSLFMILILITSCSQMKFVAEGKTTFKISANKNSEKEIVKEETVDFYFWGLLPNLHKIDLEDISSEHGLEQGSSVLIEQKISPKNLFFTLFTLGVYCPINYKILVFTNVESIN